MRVLYDNQIFWEQRYGGISNSFVKMIEQLPDEVDYSIASVQGCQNTHIMNSNIPLSRGCPVQHYSFRARMWEWMYSARLYRDTSAARQFIPSSVHLLETEEGDVFHPTNYHPYFLRHLGRRPFVLTVHDMIPEQGFVNASWQSKMKKVLAPKAAHIVAVSNFTKKAVIEILDIPESKISVIYHGAPTLSPSGVNPLKNTRYLLFVGRRSGYKFFLPMMRQLLPVLKEDNELRVVCAGPPFTAEEQLFFSKNRVDRQMIQVFPNDQDLMDYYANAIAFIFPSIQEGFGIPILEAYKAGCPVLLNKSSCFPEIAGDAAMYFHLEEQDSDLQDIMANLLNMSSKERQDLIWKQRDRLKMFSWQKAAQEYVSVYTKSCS